MTSIVLLHTKAHFSTKKSFPVDTVCNINKKDKHFVSPNDYSEKSCGLQRRSVPLQLATIKLNQ